MNASFGPIAPYYDLLMEQVPYGMWSSYYQLLLSYQGVTPESLLDVCCGTGTLAEMLTNDGFSLAGVDLSEAMIQEAQRKAALNGFQIEYLAADAANFDFGRRFDAAYSFFDSFNYITDLGQVGRAFQCVARHLEPGGSFIFDLNTAYAFEQKMFDQNNTKKKAPVRHKWKGDYDRSTRVIRVHMDFWVGEEHFVETHVQRAHSADEVSALLTAAGFGTIEIFDSYTLEPPRKTSDRIHVAALLG